MSSKTSKPIEIKVITRQDLTRFFNSIDTKNRKKLKWRSGLPSIEKPTLIAPETLNEYFKTFSDLYYSSKMLSEVKDYHTYSGLIDNYYLWMDLPLILDDCSELKTRDGVKRALIRRIFSIKEIFVFRLLKNEEDIDSKVFEIVISDFNIFLNNRLDEILSSQIIAKQLTESELFELQYVYYDLNDGDSEDGYMNKEEREEYHEDSAYVFIEILDSKFDFKPKPKTPEASSLKLFGASIWLLMKHNIIPESYNRDLKKWIQPFKPSLKKYLHSPTESKYKEFGMLFDKSNPNENLTFKELNELISNFEMVVETLEATKKKLISPPSG